MTTTSESGEWVSLREAADLLGVHPATVRNWADRGDLPSRRTNGGHRRFRRADLLRHAESQGEVQPLEAQVIIQNALGQMRMQSGSPALNAHGWYTAMSDSTREQLRGVGMRVLEALRAYMAAGAPDERLNEAIKLGQEYATILAADGLTVPQALRGFFHYSDFVVNAILTWTEIGQPRSAPEWASLLRQVNTFIHTMLLSIVEYFEEE